MKLLLDMNVPVRHTEPLAAAGLDAPTPHRCFSHVLASKIGTLNEPPG